MANKIGPTFGDELRRAGIRRFSFSWDPAGNIHETSKTTDEEREIIQQVLDAHDPDTPDVAEVKRKLAESDADMARIVEDLIDAGGDPVLLPQAALDKIAARKALRTRLAELS